LQTHTEPRSGRSYFLFASLVSLFIAFAVSCVPGTQSEQQGETENIPLDDEVGAEADVIEQGANFRLSFDNVHECAGYAFVTGEVKNTGTVPFLWADVELGWIWDHPDYDYWEGIDSDLEYHEQEKPFMPESSSCPRRMGWGNLLNPQQSAYVGVRLHLPRDGPLYEYIEWEHIVELRFCVWLSPSEYPSETDDVRECVDISHVIEEMVARTGPGRRPPGGIEPTGTNSPTPYTPKATSAPTQPSIGPPGNN